MRSASSTFGLNHQQLVLTSLYRRTRKDEVRTFNTWFEASAVSSHWFTWNDRKGNVPKQEETAAITVTFSQYEILFWCILRWMQASPWGLDACGYSAVICPPFPHPRFTSHFTRFIPLWNWKLTNHLQSQQRDLTVLDRRHTYNKRHSNRDLNRLPVTITWHANKYKEH